MQIAFRKRTGLVERVADGGQLSIDDLAQERLRVFCDANSGDTVVDAEPLVRARVLAL